MRFPDEDELELLDEEPLLEDEEDELDELPLELEDEEELLDELDEDPFKSSAPSCGALANEEPSILFPGEYFPIDFINLSWLVKLLKLKSPILFNEMPCKLLLS